MPSLATTPRRAGWIITLGLCLAAPAAVAWPMAGANEKRQSWVAEEVGGNFGIAWYRPVEPYIPQNVQVIAEGGKLFVSTARGLYAFDAATGDTLWVYPTASPLGHSPTFAGGVLYVGGHDRRLHCVDAATGARLWTFDEAKAGFGTNPVVADGLVLLGNRDGYFYAVRAQGSPGAGQLAWKYPTGGPVSFSAAYEAGVVYFASQDMHAYALTTADGSLVWRSPKLAGAGFHSFWPVLWKDKVVLTTSPNLRSMQRPGILTLNKPDLVYGGTALELINGVERDEIFPEKPAAGTLIGAAGTEPYDWAAGTTTLDATRAVNYFNLHPERRPQVLLEKATGQLHAYPAPFLNTGTKNGTHAPPMVSGQDGVLYQQANYEYGGICGGRISGWKLDTPYLSRISNGGGAVDEPRIASGGGRYLYWSLCCDRESGYIDLSSNRSAPGHEGGILPSYEGLATAIPGYDVMWFGLSTSHPRLFGSYGSPNGVYHNHTNDQNPFVPHGGRLFIHRSNALIAAKPSAGAPLAQPLAAIVPAGATDSPPTLGADELKAMLAAEVQAWLDAGHLHTGYFNGGQFGMVSFAKERFGIGDCCRRSEPMNDYFSSPGDNVAVLLRALPHLSAAQAASVRAFVQAEVAAYPLDSVVHLGWKDGASRDGFDYPPEVEADRAGLGTGTNWIPSWKNLYAMWKYAATFGGAAAAYAKVKDKVSDPPTLEQKNALVINDAIAGHLGYLELEKLAGQPETAAVRTQLDAMLAWRAGSFAKDCPFDPASPERRLCVAHNFVGLTPELGQYLKDHALPAVQAAVAEYEYVAPYWFVARYEGTNNESTLQPLYDRFALFQAKAWILGQSREELVRHLDVPAFPRGDVFYLHDLISAIEAPAQASIVATPVIAPAGGQFPGPLDVTLSCATPGAAIAYTTDGSDPNDASALYTAPLRVDHSLTLRARATKAGMVASTVTSASFTVGAPATDAGDAPDGGADAGDSTPPDAGPAPDTSAVTGCTCLSVGSSGFLAALALGWLQVVGRRRRAR